MSKQSYAGKTESVRVTPPPAFRGFVAELRMKEALGMEYITRENLTSALTQMRLAVGQKDEGSDQRELFAVMLAMLPPTFRQVAIGEIRKRAGK